MEDDLLRPQGVDVGWVHPAHLVHGTEREASG